MAVGDIFTSAGKAQVVDVYDANATGDYIGWGTDSTTPAVGDTDLGAAASEARVLAVRDQSASDTIRWVKLITADGSKTITEAGVFDAAGSGSPPTGGTPLLIRSVFTGQPVVINDTIEFTFTLQLT